MKHARASQHAVPAILTAILAVGFLMCSPTIGLARENSTTLTGNAWDAILQATQTGATGTHDHATIQLPNGMHILTKPLVIQPGNQEAGTLIIEAGPGEHPILSGGIQIIDWKQLPKAKWLSKTVQPAIWVAEAPKVDGHTLEFRQLWVNDQKAVRAREPNGDDLYRLVAWNKTNQTATIPAAALKDITRIKQAPGLEMVIDQVWEIAVLRVKSIRLEGTNALVTFREPESHIEFQHPWPPVIVKTNYQAPFFLANALQFLDSPGEWYEDARAGKIYYRPRAGEDMTTAQIYAPALETLVKIAGTSNEPVRNITFKGITFEHTTWLRPSEEGHVPLQAGMYMLEAHKLVPKGTSYHRGLDNVAYIGRPPAAVEVENAANITFENCTFEHLASAGLDFTSGTHGDLVEGCTFQDIGGNGIQMGKFSDTNIETHIPYQPTNENEICRDETIVNNLVTNCGTEDWGCVGIAAGYVRGVRIEHNEACHLPYTGISVGWGWTKTLNCMSNNVIHANEVHHVAERLNDTAGIYLLSAQPGTVVSENYVHDIRMSPYVPDPDHWYYLYLDEGSSYITVRDNWCPAEKFLKNANGPGNVWDNNGPQVSDVIKNAAGREKKFRNENGN